MIIAFTDIYFIHHSHMHNVHICAILTPLSDSFFGTHTHTRVPIPWLTPQIPAVAGRDPVKANNWEPHLSLICWVAGP